MKGHDKGARALIRRIRRGLRSRTNRWLARRAGTRKPVHAPLPTPRRILVCRPNRRIGNCLFLTPLLQTLAATYPDAEIDVLILEPANARLLRTLPGIRHVYVLPRKPLSEPGQIIKTIRAMRKQRYDVAIDPNQKSTTSHMATALSKARYRLGFAGPDQWLRLTHAAVVPDDVAHQGLQGVRLLVDAVAGTRFQTCKCLAVYPDNATRQRAQQRLHAALGERVRGVPLIGFFAQATGKKQLSVAWWQSWRRALESQGAPLQLVQIVAPGHSAIAADIPVISSPDLLELAAAIGAMDLFVAADSGPMHLAAAARTPTIGLFKATSPQAFRPLCVGALTLADEQLEPEQAARRTLQHLQTLS